MTPDAPMPAPLDDLDPMSTRWLLGQHHAGDPTALGQLIARELPTIREHVQRKLGGALRKRMDTGDMVSEVCLMILQKGPRFLVRDPAAFHALMSRIIRNRIISMYRAYGPSVERERSLDTPSSIDLDGSGFDPKSPATTPPDGAAREEDRERVRLALMLLDPLDAEVLRLRDDVDLSFVEMAARLHKAQDALRMRYKRALAKLERCVVQLRAGRLTAMLGELDADAEGDDA